MSVINSNLGLILHRLVTIARTGCRDLQGHPRSVISIGKCTFSYPPSFNPQFWKCPSWSRWL